MSNGTLAESIAKRWGAVIKGRRAAGESYQQIAEHITSQGAQVSKSTVRRAAQHVDDMHIEKPALKITGLQVQSQIVDEPIEKLWQRKLEAWDRQYARHTALRERVVEVSDARPIGIVHFGDPHVDSPGCNLRLLREHLEIVRSTDGMWAGAVGDYHDNWIGRLARLHAESGTTADETFRLAESIFQLAPHLYCITGNHDEWADSRYLLELMRKSGVKVIGRHQARIRLKFHEGRDLVVLIRHYFPGHSQWNPSHGLMKRGAFDPSADIYVQGHTHTMIGVQTPHPGFDGRVRTFAVVHGYKMVDDYALERGFAAHERGAACCTIYDPMADSEEGRILLLWDLHQAAEILTSMRARR